MNINGTMKKMSKAYTIISGIGIFLVGVIILAISLYAYMNYHELDSKTIATISDIKKEKIEDVFRDDENLNYEEEYNYTVYVDYEVNGKEYKHIQYDSYDSSMKIGQNIEIQYDSNEPSKIQSTNGKTFILVFIIIGALAILFGIYQIIRGIKLDKNNAMYDVMK